MANIVKIKTMAERDKETAITVLTDALESVKAGYHSGVAVALITPSGVASTVWSDAPATLLVGAVSILKHRLLNSLEE